MHNSKWHCRCLYRQFPYQATSVSLAIHHGCTSKYSYIIYKRLPLSNRRYNKSTLWLHLVNSVLHATPDGKCFKDPAKLFNCASVVTVQQRPSRHNVAHICIITPRWTFMLYGMQRQKFESGQICDFVKSLLRQSTSLLCSLKCYLCDNPSRGITIATSVHRA